LSERFHGQGKHVTNTTLGPNDTRRTRINLKLAPEPKDLHIYGAAEHVLMNTRRLQEALAG
jgi:hypothetical protein